MYVGMYVGRYAYICLCVYAGRWVCTKVCIHAGRDLCMYVCLSVCLYVYMEGGIPRGGRWPVDWIIYIYISRICQRKFRSLYFCFPELCKSTDRMVTAMKVNINEFQQHWLTTAIMVTAMKVNSTDFPSHESPKMSTAMMVTALKVNNNDGRSMSQQ